jgi:hypothetical protein
MNSDVTLIMRECGERTADACADLLGEIFPGLPVIRVLAGPFVATLREGLERGLAAGRPWTLCMDADVLPLPGLRDFVDEARGLPDHFVEAQALVADKLLPSLRPAGNHLYRTALIPKALTAIPEEGALRPESSMLDILARSGHPNHQSARLIGLHDFEQAPVDIYSKAALHGHKHAYLADLLLPLWKRWADRDPDYEIALAAFTQASNGPPPDGIARRGPAGGITDTKPSLPPLSMADLAALLAEAPHLHPEAQAFRRRLEQDVNDVIAHQRRQYALVLPLWRRWWHRVRHRYPYLRQPA